MNRLALGIALLWIVSVSACECSRPITVEKIQRDVVGKTVGIAAYGTGKPDSWTFGADDELEINAVEYDCGPRKAAISVTISTRSFAGVAIAEASGKLALSYERVGSAWVLREVHNESFEIDQIIIGSPH